MNYLTNPNLERGQMRNITLPSIFSIATGPKSLLSRLTVLLSPIQKYCPSGIVKG